MIFDKYEVEYRKKFPTGFCDVTKVFTNYNEARYFAYNKYIKGKLLSFIGCVTGFGAKRISYYNFDTGCFEGDITVTI